MATSPPFPSAIFPLFLRLAKTFPLPPSTPKSVLQGRKPPFFFPMSPNVWKSSPRFSAIHPLSSNLAFDLSRSLCFSTRSTQLHRTRHSRPRASTRPQLFRWGKVLLDCPPPLDLFRFFSITENNSPASIAPFLLPPPGPVTRSLLPRERCEEHVFVSSPPYFSESGKR